MTAIPWPNVLHYRSISPELTGVTVTGGRSMSGIEQRTLRHPGYWRIRVDGIVINTADRARAYRALVARLRAGETVDVPIADPYRADRSTEPSRSAKVATLAAAGATSLILSIVGYDVDQGNYASISGRLHLITDITSGTGDGLFNQLVTDFPWDDSIPWVDEPVAITTTTASILPPLRAAAAVDAAVEFARPVVTCRLASPDSGDVTLDMLRFGVASLDLVENF